jgi:hypothetical protein
MPSHRIKDFYNLLSQDSFVLIYLGAFDDALTPILMDINDAGKSEMRSSRKKISYLIAECFQNIIRHSDKTNRAAINEDVPEMFILRDRNRIHHLVTTNIVQNNHTANLSAKLDSLQNLNAAELKEMYMQIFQNSETSAKGGAGLGLIDMARKSGVAPTYKFVDMGNNFSNFFMQVNVIPKDFSGTLAEDDYSLNSALAIYDQMVSEKIVIVQKGDFSQEAVLPLIQLFENNLNLKEAEVAVAKKVLYLLIEMLQNMTRHAEKINGMKEGIFYISESGSGNYEISTGNFLQKNQAQNLKEKLDAIVDLDKLALAKKYKQQLMNSEETEGKGAGIGLIELCRHSSDRINYDISPAENGLAFFSLHVKV